MRIEKDHWIVSGVIALLFVAFGLGVWMPNSQRLASYRDRIAEAQEKLGPNFNQPAAMADRQAEVAQLRQQVNSSDRYVPDGPELASVLRSLAEAVETQGISEQAFQSQQTREFKHYSEAPVEIEFESGFAAAYSVLEQIETMPRLVRVDALSLRVSNPNHGEAVQKPRVQVSYRLSSFFTGRQEEGL